MAERRTKKGASAERNAPDGEPGESLPAPEASSGRWHGIRKSYIWALMISIAIAAWMGSGQIIVGGQEHPETVAEGGPDTDTEDGKDKALFRVRVRDFQTESRAAALILRGRTETDARLHVKSQTAGLVDSLAVQKGARVKRGDLLCRLELGARKAKVLEARAKVALAELDYKASSKLAQKGHSSKLKVAADKATLDAALAELERVMLDLERTGIVAPLDGVIEDVPAEIGDYLPVGGVCAHLVQLDPLVVVGTVSERDVGKLRQGMDASAKLITGQTVPGKIRYIAPASDPKTRTFRVEAEIANADRALREGVTTDLTILFDAEPAHRLPTSVLTLDDAGRIGVRTVDDGNIVRFLPVKLLDDAQTNVWVGGLPERIRIIVVGQDYVTDGQKVDPVPDEALTAAARSGRSDRSDRTGKGK